MSTTINFATSSDDDTALETAIDEHAELVGALATYVARARGAAQDTTRSTTAQAELVDWARRDLLPHLTATEQHLYPAAHGLTEGRALVGGLVLQQRAVEQLVDLIGDATSAVQVAALATALHTVMEVHVRTEDELLLPLLAAAPSVSLGELTAAVAAARSPVEDAPPAAAAAAEPHACGCGEHDHDVPELDARLVPHAIRHATVFGALDAVGPGREMDLVAPHDPLPLLAQIGQRYPGEFTTEYLERGPEAWRLRFQRRAR